MRNRWLLFGFHRYNEDREDIDDNARRETGEHRDERPQQPENHRVDSPVLPQTAKNPREYPIRTAPIQMLDRRFHRNMS